MTLSTRAKDYIASHFGRNNCYASSGVSYTDPTGTRQTGSTMDVVSTLEEDPFGNGPARGPGGEMYKNIPNYQSITPQDIMGIGSSSWCVGDGGGGGTTPQQVCEPYTEHCYNGHIYECNPDGTRGPRTEYCQHGCEIVNNIPRCKAAPNGGTPSQICTPNTKRCNRGNIETCNSQGTVWNISTYCGDGCEVVNGVPTCRAVGAGDVSGSQDTTGPMEVWVGEGSGTSCPPGDPRVTLDTSNAYAYYKSDPTSYVGVMDIMVRNNNNEDCYAYFAWEMRMWPGSGLTSCPLTTPEVVEISRFLARVSATRDITLKKILANETEMVSGSFAIPHGVEGQKTICLTLWGNYSYSALVDELAAAGYSKEIPW